MAVVSNSSPLIALEQIGQLELLRELYRAILIPEAVSNEIAESVAPRDWLQTRSVTAPVPLETQRSAIGPGEREAIGLALQVQAAAILLDDDPARRLAIQLGLPVIGTAGILLIAKERKLIPAVKPHLDALLAKRFFLGSQTYKDRKSVV